jgi:HEAT repeat protein/predicted Ser/Thr protein kinase
VALVPGSNAGPYRIVEPLGRGGMATVYRAYEPKLDRYVALKVLPREFLHDPGFARRFRQEAQVIAKLEHPNIIPIYAYDIEEAEGIPWMAMRLVAGGSLSDLLKRERPALSRSVEVLRGVADALDYAHGKGIVHRDVKPQNVLLDEGGRVYLADFGIAKILESSGGLTATGMITGTPQYMAPEQATGTKIGPQADVYALGIVAYEMFTGRVPFSADTPVAVLMKHMQEPLPLPSPQTVPEPLLRPLLKCTAKKPEERWPSAGAFVGALEAGLETRTLPPTADVPTMEVLRPAGAQPPLPTRTARPQPLVRSVPTIAAPPARRGGLAPAALIGLGVAGLLVLAGAVGVAVLVLRGGPKPAASPSPTVAAAATPLPARLSVPVPVPATPTPPPAVPMPAAAAPPRRDTAPLAAPTPSVPRPVPTPVSTPELTPTPAHPAEPAAPAVDPEVQRLAAALADRDPATRRRAAQDLASLGSEAAPALTALTAALGDRTPDVRLRAAEALGRIGPAARPAVPALAQALRDADPMVRAEAAKTLGLMADAAAPAAVPLGEALASPDVAVRREAAKALARVGRGAEPALRALLVALDDKDKTVRAQAARALGRIGPPARGAVPALTAMSRDSDVIVSREARAALESIGP